MVHVIAVGNEKGGSGKSTTAVNLAVALMVCGTETALVDLDLRQRTSSIFLRNRSNYDATGEANLETPELLPLPEIDPKTLARPGRAPLVALDKLIKDADGKYDSVVIDCPGTHNGLSVHAHWCADTIVIPINDSLVDLSGLANVDNGAIEFSSYAEVLLKHKKMREDRGLKASDYVIVRNRISSYNLRNKQVVSEELEHIASALGARVLPGFGDRVIYKEQFKNGLTLLDYQHVTPERNRLANVAARQELRNMMNALRIPDLMVNF